MFGAAGFFQCAFCLESKIRHAIIRSYEASSVKVFCLESKIRHAIIAFYVLYSYKSFCLESKIRHAIIKKVEKKC